MYGFICYVFERFLRYRFGMIVAEKVRLKVGINNDDPFRKYQVVSDQLVVNLLVAAKEITGLTLDQLLEELGRTFYETCKITGHNRLMKSLGSDLKAFLLNLDSLHSYLTISFSEMRAPSFHCESSKDGSMLLHYYSQRKGLEHIVIGIVQAVARDIYEIPVQMKILTREDGHWGDKSYHVSFAVNALNTAAIPSSVTVPISSSTTQWPYSYQEVFNQASPCNVMFDQATVLVNVGDTIKRLIPDIHLGNSKLEDYFSIIKPEMELTFDNIKTYQNAVFAFSPHSSTEPNIVIQGQIKLVQAEAMAVFLGGIRKPKGADDNHASLGLVNMHFKMQKEREMMMQLEETEIKLNKVQTELEYEAGKVDNLVHSMLPNFVVKQLSQGKKAVKLPGDKTILSSDIKGFTVLCQDCSPHEVVEMLTKLYTLYDKLIEKHKVYKVEVIGDAYVVAGGLMDDDKQDHVTAIVNMALDMLEETAKVESPRSKDTTLQIRIGIHTGSVVAAVVGTKMLHYCLFGDTVNISKIMESTGTPSRIHISEATYWSLPNTKKFSFECRGQMEIRPGSQMTTYYLERPKAEPPVPTPIAVASATPSVAVVSTTPPAEVLSIHKSKQSHCVLS